MLRHNERSSGVARHAIAGWVRAEMDALCDTILAGHRAAGAGYSVLPPEQLDGDVRAITRVNLEIVATWLDGDATGRDAAAHHLRESAARRAEEGLPLETVLGSYHLGARVLLDAAVDAGLFEIGSPPWQDAMAAMLDHLAWVAPLVTSGYVEFESDQAGTDGPNRQVAMSVLLSGASPRTAARVGGILLPDRVVVLALAMAPHPDAAASAVVDPDVVERRKVRRVRGELERQFPGEVLASLGQEGGFVVLPLADHDVPPGPDLPDPLVRRLRSLLRDLGVVAGTDVRASVVAGPTDDVRTTADLAREVLRLAGLARRDGAVLQLRDVAVEYQLTRPGPALDTLAARLDRLDGHPELEATLASYLGRDCARRAAAADLHVHPNTVDHRLRRIAELVGLDLGRPGDLVIARAALLARASRTPPSPWPTRRW